MTGDEPWKSSGFADDFVDDRPEMPPDAAMTRLNLQLARFGAVARMALIQRYRHPKVMEAGRLENPDAFAAALRQYDKGLVMLAAFTRLLEGAATRAREVAASADNERRVE